MDMLIALYESLPAATPGHASLRKPLGPEQGAVIRWVQANFSLAWSSEASAALSNRPAAQRIDEEHVVEPRGGAARLSFPGEAAVVGAQHGPTDHGVEADRITDRIGGEVDAVQLARRARVPELPLH